MKHKYTYLLVLIILCLYKTKAQDGPVLTFNIPTQNTLQFNRFLINPNFSVAREHDTHLTMYHRNQWIQFDDSPELYMLSYSGKFGEKSGMGIGLYQQNIGIITSFGGVANYAYYLKLTEKISMGVGFNLAYYSSGINRNRAVTNEPDPAIMALSNNSILTLKPGINITWGSFDFGVYAEDLVDYDFKTSQLIKEYSNKTFSTHLMYTQALNSQTAIFEKGSMSLLLRGKMNQTDDFKYGGSILVNFPYLGWIQSGIDDFYGISIGAGAHLTNRLSLGYVYERVINDGLVNLGPTHEITLAFRFQSKSNPTVLRNFDNTKGISVAKTQPKIEEEDEVYYDESHDTSAPKNKPTTQQINNYYLINSGEKQGSFEDFVNAANTQHKSNNDFDKDLELEKLRMTIDQNNARLIEMLADDQLASDPTSPEDFKKQVDNLRKYIQRLEQTIAQKADKGECNCEDDDNNQPNPVATNQKNITSVANNTTSEQAVPAKTIQNNNTSEAKPKTTSNSNSSSNPPKKDLENALGEMKSATKKSTSDLDKTVRKQALNLKFSATGVPDKESLNASRYSLTDEEIREYYSKHTNVQRTKATKNYLNVPGLEGGYYIICNVFSEPVYADAFMKQLKSKGYQCQYFVNPKNNFRYVYLKKFDNWNDALISYYTNIDNTYFDLIWIMNININ